MIQRRSRAPGRWLAAAALACVFSVTSSCILFDSENPETARLVFDFEGGAAGANNLHLIWSNRFTAERNGPQDQAQVFLTSADTIPLSLPYDEVFSLGPNQRFFAQVVNLDSAAVAISARFFIDEDERGTRTAAVGPATPLEFLYVLASF